MALAQKHEISAASSADVPRSSGSALLAQFGLGITIKAAIVVLLEMVALLVKSTSSSVVELKKLAPKVDSEVKSAAGEQGLISPLPIRRPHRLLQDVPGPDTTFRRPEFP
ncbi:hypothetical protein FOXB_12542 [Fusarium oxysporum f. sp. conglutinans Fo5176]|uniref:Uncharacterized protein n=1 Tax=Fusarium oxysporum (strain Fo5176) TaxID=660025 RepID=F9G1L0_FUSOF|nr:hypothetical protein FOXB_12542 [Fusarium oxysporum f. sp. conglutinans Fo5176]